MRTSSSDRLPATSTERAAKTHSPAGGENVSSGDDVNRIPAPSGVMSSQSTVRSEPDIHAS